jgi:uncharacterized membrane protein YgcG
MLYLTEHEPLVAQDSEAFKTTDLRMVHRGGGAPGAAAGCLPELPAAARSPLQLAARCSSLPAAAPWPCAPHTASSYSLPSPPKKIFGATDEDTDRLRIVSLVELDADRLDRLMAGDASAEGRGGSGGSGGGGGGGGGSGATGGSAAAAS